MNKFNLGVNDLIEILKNLDLKEVPISIFKSPLSPLEALVTFLKSKEYNFHQIGEILGRSEKTIWTTHSNSIKKLSKINEHFILNEDGRSVPLSLFCERKLSVLENLCLYLSKEGLGLSEIGNLIGKDRRVIWTVCNRAKKKLGEK